MMKTPREILLHRHASAGEKLDAIRHQVLTAGGERETRDSPAPTPWWRELLWPGPKAWASLAAVWAVILALQFAARDQTDRLAGNAVRERPMAAALQLQRRLLAELIGQSAPAEAVPPETYRFRPRSELRNEFLTA